MNGEYWVFAIVTFLFVLSVKKYFDLESLRESIEEYLSPRLLLNPHGVEIHRRRRYS